MPHSRRTSSIFIVSNESTLTKILCSCSSKSQLLSKFVLVHQMPKPRWRSQRLSERNKMMRLILLSSWPCTVSSSIDFCLTFARWMTAPAQRFWPLVQCCQMLSTNAYSIYIFDWNMSTECFLKTLSLFISKLDRKMVAFGLVNDIIANILSTFTYIYYILLLL